MSSSHPVRWFAFLLCGALSVVGCTSSTDGPQGETGALSLDLVIGDGTLINEVAWQITGNDMDMSGTIDVSAPGSTASVEVFGLPPGEERYIVMLTATSADEEVTCKGSTSFNVEIGETTDVTVMLNCKLPERLGAVRVNGEFNICAELIKAVVSPLQTSVGNRIDLSAQGKDADGDAITYEWTATGGEIGDENAPMTTYTCREVGQQLIRIMVTDNDVFCDMAEWTVPVECVPSDGDLCDGNTCDDNDTECNDSVCDGETGACVDNPIEGPCDSGNGTCMAGECVDNCLDVVCDDLGECISNECNSQTGACEQTDLDGEVCEGDTGVCREGACIITDLCDGNTCDDNDTECNDSVCDGETGGCVDNPIEGPCDSGNGTCMAGECVDNCLDVVCDDLGECISNECNSQTGACEQTDLDGEVCEGDTGVCREGACIITDLCDGNTCGDNDTECNDSVCDGETGGCVDNPIEGPCDSGNGTCMASECVDNCLDVVCDDLGECISNECNSQTGACEQTDLDGELCEGDTGVCEEGACVVEQAPATCDPTAQGAVVPCTTPELVALDCFLLGSGAPIPLDPVIEPSAVAFAGVPLDVTPTVTLNLPASLVCGFATVVPSAIVFNSLANLDVAGATPTSIALNSFLGDPPASPHGGVPFDFKVGCGNQAGACSGGFCNGGTTACNTDNDCLETGPGVVVPLVAGSPTSSPGTETLTPSAAGAITFSYGFDDIGAVINVPALFANLCLGQIAEDNGPPTPPGGSCGFVCVPADRTGDGDTSDPNDAPRVMYDAQCDKAGALAGDCEPFFDFSGAANVCATGQPGSALAETEAPCNGEDSTSLRGEDCAGGVSCGDCQQVTGPAPLSVFSPQQDWPIVEFCSSVPGNGDGRCAGTSAFIRCPNGDSDCRNTDGSGIGAGGEDYCIVPCATCDQQDCCDWIQTRYPNATLAQFPELPVNPAP